MLAAAHVFVLIQLCTARLFPNPSARQLEFQVGDDEIGHGATGSIYDFKLPGLSLDTLVIKTPRDSWGANAILEETKLYSEIYNSIGTEGLVKFYGVVYTIPGNHHQVEFVPIEAFRIEDKNNFYGIVMEICEYCLDEEGIFLETRISYLDQAARTLARLNAEGYVHRDIKSANIMICGDSAKLIDFGFSYRVPDGPSNPETFPAGYAFRGTQDSVLPRSQFDLAVESTDAFALAMSLVDLTSSSTFWTIATCNTAKSILAHSDRGIANELECIPKFLSSSFSISSIEGIPDVSYLPGSDQRNVVLSEDLTPHYRSISYAAKLAFSQAFSELTTANVQNAIQTFLHSLQDPFSPRLPKLDLYNDMYSLVMTNKPSLLSDVKEEGTFVLEEDSLVFYVEGENLPISFADALTDYKSVSDIPTVLSYLVSSEIKMEDFIESLITLSDMPASDPSTRLFTHADRFLRPILDLPHVFSKCKDLLRQRHGKMVFPYDRYLSTYRQLVFRVARHWYNDFDFYKFISAARSSMPNQDSLLDCEAMHFLVDAIDSCSDEDCIIIPHAGNKFSVFQKLSSPKQSDASDNYNTFPDVADDESEELVDTSDNENLVFYDAQEGRNMRPLYRQDTGEDSLDGYETAPEYLEEVHDHPEREAHVDDRFRLVM